MGRTFACSDLHGYYGLWAQIAAHCAPDDKIIFLGDACDRGVDGIQIMQELLTDARVTYVLGNHEDMLIDNALDWFELRKVTNAQIIKANGGLWTMNMFLEMPQEEQQQLIQKLQQLPTMVDYTNSSGQLIHLCHAGFTPGQLPQFKSDLEEYMFFLWDRHHIHDKWTGADNEFVVHGHTPVGSIIPRSEEILYYGDGHKFNIDLGTPTTRRAALLNLDTFEPTYFEV